MLSTMMEQKRLTFDRCRPHSVTFVNLLEILRKFIWKRERSVSILLQFVVVVVRLKSCSSYLLYSGLSLG